MPRAREGDVGEPTIHQSGIVAIRSEMNQDTVGRLALARIAGQGIAVIDMAVVSEIQSNRPPRIESHPEITAGIDTLDRGKLAVRNPLLFEGRGELDPLPLGEVSLLRSVDIDALQPPRIVSDLRPRPGAAP